MNAKSIAFKIVLGFCFGIGFSTHLCGASPQDASALKIATCRTKLKEIESMRSPAMPMEILRDFEDLASRAHGILDTLETDAQTKELDLLIDECQGILNRLNALFELKPTIKKKKFKGSPPNIIPGTSKEQPVVSRPNPLPVKEKKEKEEDDAFKASVVPIQVGFYDPSLGSPSSIDNHDNPIQP